MLFYHICDYEKEIEWNSFGFELKKSASSFVEKIGQKRIKEDEFIEKIKKSLKKDDYYKEKSKFNLWSIRKPGSEEPVYTINDVIAYDRKRYEHIYWRENWRIEI